MEASKLRHILRRLTKGFLAAMILNPWRKKAFYLSHEFPGEVTTRPNSVTFNLLDLTVQISSFEFFLDSYALIRQLHMTKPTKFYFENGLLLVRIDDIVVNPTTSEEFFILHEIFVRGIYNFDLPGPSVVIDVGLNVGIASLFFASKADVTAIVAFEPFQPTYRQATRNLELNSSLARKIHFENYGLGPKEETLEVAYDYTHKGQVGIHGTDLVRSMPKKVEKQKIEIKEAANVLREILERFSGQSLVLKLDCEGSEYGILKNLAERKLLGIFRLVFIEWHQEGPEPLLELLRAAGFVSFYHHSSEHVGIIYGAK